MGIDLAMWRARIELNYSRQSRYACRRLSVQWTWRAERWGVEEVMNSTPLLLQGCMAVVSLSLILGYTFRRRLTGRRGCGKVYRPKLRDGSVLSAEVRGMADTGVCLSLAVCAVVLALLLMAGDVERHPGPTGKEGLDQVDKVLPTVDNTPLGQDDHFDILTEMMPVASSWKAIGRGLRIDPGRLNTIQDSYPGKPKECLSEMLTCWLNRNYNVERFGEPTWRAVVKVVAHPAAGDNCALALTIAEQHSVVSTTVSQTTKKTIFRSQEDSCAGNAASDEMFTSEGARVSPGPSSSTQSEETQKPLKAASPTPATTTSSFPYLKVSGLTPEQQERLRIRLCVESEDIVHKFWHLHSRIYESLLHRNVPVGRLVAHLSLLHAFDHVYKESQKPALQSFFQELRNAGSIEDVLYIIKDYFSFFNYHVIEHIVDGLGTDQDRVELQKYGKAFDEYSKRRVYECPPEYGSKSSADHVDLVVKVDSVYKEFTVKELKKFEYRLSRIFFVSPQSVLRLCRVEEGCLHLIFQVPSFVQQEIFPLSSEQESALTAEDVIRLTCGDYQFAAKRDEDGSEPEDTESVAELRDQMFQAALTVHDIDADSAMGTTIITDDRSSCWFSDDDETLCDVPDKIQHDSTVWAFVRAIAENKKTQVGSQSNSAVSYPRRPLAKPEKPDKQPTRPVTAPLHLLVPPSHIQTKRGPPSPRKVPLPRPSMLKVAKAPTAKDEWSEDSDQEKGIITYYFRGSACTVEVDFCLLEEPSLLPLQWAIQKHLRQKDIVLNYKDSSGDLVEMTSNEDIELMKSEGISLQIKSSGTHAPWAIYVTMAGDHNPYNTSPYK